MAIYPKVNGEYKEMSDCKVKVAGTWKQAKKLFTKVNGVWKEAWNSGIKVSLYSGEVLTIPITKRTESPTQCTLKGVKIRIIDIYSGAVYAENYIGDCSIAYNNNRFITSSVTYKSNTCTFIIYLETPNPTYKNMKVECSIMPSNASSYYLGEIEYTSCVGI